MGATSSSESGMQKRIPASVPENAGSKGFIWHLRGWSYRTQEYASLRRKCIGKSRAQRAGFRAGSRLSDPAGVSQRDQWMSAFSLIQNPEPHADTGCETSVRSRQKEG